MDNDTKWWLAALGYECAFAWVVALIIFNVGELIVFGTFTVWTGVAFVALALMLFQLFRPMPKYDKSDSKILSDLSQERS
jgi:ferrous iron transport protein B